MKALNYKKAIMSICCNHNVWGTLIPDYTQEILIKLLKYKDKEISYKLVYRTTVNYIIDQVRATESQKRKQQLIFDYDYKVNDCDYVKDQLSQLSKIPNYDIFLARYHYGYTYNEISKKIGINTATLRSKVFQFKKKARKILEAA